MEKIFDSANCLSGKTLNGKWNVIEKMKKEKDETGGNFSVGYIVEDVKGKRAFLKAIDFSNPFSKSANVNVMKLLNLMTKAYQFEVELLNKCAGSNLKYVVKLLDADQYMEDQFVYPVPYMVFEFAETSARKCLDISGKIDFAWSLRSLHNIAVALNELHTVNIAHQDVKPSNVMIFDNKKVSKIGDVGRSSMLGEEMEHDIYTVAGDSSYSPWEQLYGWTDSDWEIRRYSCDMYMLGNLIYTYFNGMSINFSMLNKMESAYRPELIGGSYQGSYTDVLPLLVHVFDSVLNEFNNNINNDLRDELISLVRQLCHPDYQNNRGDLKKHGSQRYSMERFISKLDLLSNKYEYELKKGVRK